MCLVAGGAGNGGPCRQVGGGGVQLTQHRGVPTAGGVDVLGKQRGGPLYDTARQLKFQGLRIEPAVTTPAASRHSRSGRRGGEWRLGI
jgi:hypothetical protein